MADISLTVLIIAVAGIVSCISRLHLASAIICYDCDALPHQRDCSRVTECGPDEECYGEREQTPDGLIKFRSGCIHSSKCNISTEVLPVIGKRSSDTTECSKCCNSSYCNLETCDKPYASRIKRCLSCKYALRPDECSESIQCSDGEVCYSQTLIHNSERRFRLGCIHRQQCEINAINQVSNVVQQPDGYCGQCCEGNNCNRDICGQRKVQHYKLIKPPPLKFCRDNSTLTCAAKTRQCSQEYYKFFQCPYSCNQCGVFHYTVSVTSTTAMPISSEKSATTVDARNLCIDIPGINCAPITCTVPSIAKLCKRTCGLCSAITTLATTTLGFTDQDPLPDCQCAYLDREANLCTESEKFEDLKRFCCYYCNTKKGIFTYPDITCLRLEKPEHAEVDRLPKPIDCISN